MRHAIKQGGKKVQAYQLGAGTSAEQELIQEDVIVRRPDGSYEVFSQEAVNGTGEIAMIGDYFKIDEKNGKHFPYPIEKKWFEKHHRLLYDHWFEEIPQSVDFYQLGDPVSPEIKQLLDSGRLKINSSDPDKTFCAKLWGTELSAPSDGTVVIYGKDQDGSIDFSLIRAKEFQRNYTEIQEP